MRPILAATCAAALLTAGWGLRPARAQAGGQAPGTPAAPAAPKQTSGQATLTLVVPVEGQYYAEFVPGAGARDLDQLPHRFTDKKTSILYDPAALGKSPQVSVLDATTGNVAVRPLPPGGTLELRRIDFDRVGRLEVKVTSEGKPVQSAVVSLATPDKKTTSRTITATSSGTAVFENVPTGNIKVSVRYGDGQEASQDYPLTGDHASPVVTVPVAVPIKVPTVEAPAGEAPAAATAAPAAGAPPAAPASPPPARGSGIVDLLGTLIGLAVAGGAIYLLYRWAQSGGMAATLKKAGIEVSGPAPASDAGTPWQPNAPAAPVVSDPSLCPFCGQRKDAAGNCACSVAGGTAGAAVVGPAASSQPRLVGTVGVYSGTIFPLAPNGSPVSVGREPTNGVPLPNDTTVSRRHASIRMENGAYLVADEGSSNGVFVNGVKIAGAHPLQPGDEVQIGNTRFRFEV